MELRHLIYFKALAEELHFGRAAEKLFISQPPLSRQIKDLENELGVQLFERNKKRVTLTEAGSFFLSEVVTLLHRLDQAKIKARQIQDAVAGEFRLGYISSCPETVLTKVLGTVGKELPFLKIRLYEASSQRQQAALENGKLDLGIVRAPVISAQLRTQLLMREGFCLAASAESPGPALEALGEMPFVSYNKDYAPDYYQQVLWCCHQLGFEPRTVHECNSLSSVLELVAGGLGVTVVPASAQFRFRHLDVTFQPLDGLNVTTDTVLAFDAESKHPALPLFTRLLAEQFLNAQPDGLPAGFRFVAQRRRTML